MSHKKSMRIFWLSLGLLLVSGTVIIAVVQHRSHKKENGALQMEDEKMNRASRVKESHADMDTDAGDDGQNMSMHQDAAGSYRKQEETQTDTQVKPVSGNTAEYRFELRAKNGYLEVYYYHTENLFFHTGIPYSVLTLEQRQELERGKYFLSEQELYGYLESCTS